MFSVKQSLNRPKQRVVVVSWLLLFLSFLNLHGATPTRVPSFGPNGTHWPGQVSGLITPYMYDETVPHRIEVACNIEAVTAAINALTFEQVAQGVLILVQPGTLVGGGGSNQSPQMMDAVGNKAWTKRVTICPRDGWGSVTISNGIRMQRIRNLCFAGFIIDGKIRIQSSTRFSFARCLVNGNITIYGTIEHENDPKQWEFVELVKAVVFQGDPTDPMQLQTFPNMGKHLQGVVFDGCYFAPNYMPIGHSAHQDTIQHLAHGSAFFQNETIRDTVVFASNRCAINGGFYDTLIQNCWLNSRKDNQTPRYPVGAGNEMLNGGVNQGTVAGVTFDGGYVMGKLQSNQGASSNPYPIVKNGAKIDYELSGHVRPTSGSWIVDTKMNGHTNPGYPPLPTASYLQSIWKKGAIPPTGSMTSEPLFFPPGDVYDSQQSVTITSSTDGATIHYTTDGSEPTISSQVYSTPLTVSSATTLKAFATKESLDPSPINVANYEIRVVTPVFLPNGGEFLLPQSVIISSSTQGADIYYTLDGSTPTTSSSRYTGALTVASNATIKAIAVKSGLPVSGVRSADYVIGANTYTLSDDWVNLALPSYTGPFEMSWNFKPTALGVDVVMGVGEELAESYTELACIVRFMSTGIVDARDGSNYKAVSALAYQVDKIYQIRISVDVAAKRYSATVTPMGGSPVVIAQNYAFRTEQSQTSRFGTFAFVRYGSGGGTLSGATLGSAGVSPSRPQGLRVITK